MNSKIKNIVISIGFIALIFGYLIVGAVSPDNEISYSERRKLKQFPVLSFETIADGSFFGNFEKYALDQAPFRDSLRTVKALSHFYVFNQKDNNDIFIIGGNAFKIQYPLRDKSVAEAGEKFNSVYSKYLWGMKVYYTVLPDKNTYAAAEYGYPVIDFKNCVGILRAAVKNMEYIDLYDCLSVKDFYGTDPHWAQQNLFKVITRLAEKMDFYAPDIKSYTANKLYPFYGAYYGQSALPLLPDEMVYLTSDAINGATARDLVTGESFPVYNTEKFGGIDSYELFLNGGLSLIEIANPAADSDKELIIFRDSSGSSLAPLLIGGYKKITLIDLRYISTRLVGEYVDFNDQDVLFMYNIAILNNSQMLK